MTFRKSLNRFFARYEIIWELFMIALAVVIDHKIDEEE